MPSSKVSLDIFLFELKIRIIFIIYTPSPILYCISQLGEYIGDQGY